LLSLPGDPQSNPVIITISVIEELTRENNMDHSEVTEGAREFPRKLELNHSTLIRADALRVYQALTTSKGLDAWFTTGASVDAHPGGEIHFRWVNWGPERISTEDRGPVLEAIPGSRFVFQWHPDLPVYATTVEINLTPIDGGTIVSLREHGFADTDSGIAALGNCAAGWGEALTLLKFYLEHGLCY
jgi:uncharacterized protein YndB with AHSA1/START domain